MRAVLVGPAVRAKWQRLELIEQIPVGAAGQLFEDPAQLVD